ncbi:MAG: trypsin-like peptidase domain-containing protein [Trichodesmium sp. MAG_R04]|nr:trypsin-like peptidase domain-containing protein [Trichodesmium sp. MAG_R04]
MSNLEDSIVIIKSAKKENVIGTGFIFHKQHNYTYLLTCAHVIRDVGGEENIRVNGSRAEVIKIGDVQGLDLAILKINTTFSASSLDLMILYGKQEKKLEVNIPGCYLFGEDHALSRKTIKGKMIVEANGEKALQIIENVTEKVAVGKLEIKKGILRDGYSGAPVIDTNTGLVMGIVTHKIKGDGEGKFGRAISIEALEKIWPEIPADVSHKIRRESSKNNNRDLWYISFLCVLLAFIVILDYIEKNKSRSIFDLCPIESEFLTCGEKEGNIDINFPENMPSSRQESLGRNKLAQGNYEQAVRHLNNAWEGEDADKDPSLLIALNNAKIMQDIQKESLSKKQVYAISVAIPFTNTLKYVSKNILRGVAWKQYKFNNNEDSSWKLLVLMADDHNDGKQAEKIAKEIGSYNDTLDNPILGFIGHYSSRATTHVINKYHELKINQITPGASSTRESLNKIYKKFFSSKNALNTKLDFSFFFRVVGTTSEAMDAVIKYINNENIEIEYVIIFRDSTDAFAFSSSYEAKKLLPKTIQEKNIVECELNGKTESNLRKKLREYKNNPLYNENNTVIFLFMGAYTQSQKDQNKAIIEENKGDFLLIGNNPVYTPDFLNTYSKNKSVLKNIIIRRFWVPSKSDPNIQEFQSFWNTKDDLITRLGASYDATEMFILAISQEHKNKGTPTPEGINKALLNTDFEGMTGPIKIIKNGENYGENNQGDRKNAKYYLIKPYCNGNDECKWMRLNPHSAGQN